MMKKMEKNNYVAPEVKVVPKFNSTSEMWKAVLDKTLVPGDEYFITLNGEDVHCVYSDEVVPNRAVNIMDVLAGVLPASTSEVKLSYGENDLTEEGLKSHYVTDPLDVLQLANEVNNAQKAE